MRWRCTIDLLQFTIRILERHNGTVYPTWGRHDHCDPYWRLYINKCQGAYLSIGDERYDLTPNRIHLVPAWVHLRCHSTVESPHLYIHFDVLGLSRPVVREIFPRPVMLAGEADHGAMVRRLWGAGGSTLSDAFATTMAAQGLVSESIGRACGALPAERLRRLTSAGVDGGPMAPVLQFIESRLDQRMDNTVLAGTAQMSKRSFIRAFGRSVRQTPARYSTERRVAAAADRLVRSDGSIESIAAEFGFANRFYFTRVFTRVMGISPARYRRGVRASA